MNDTIIKFDNVSVGYNRTVILENLNFEIYDNDFVGLVGANGVGKTTLLNTIIGVLKPLKGKIQFLKNIKFGYCKQRYNVATKFPLTVFDVVLMGLLAEKKFGEKFSSEDKEKVYNILELVGIKKLSNKFLYEISGGEKQKVLISHALVSQPKCLLLDEPTSDLDVKSEREILNLIKNLNEQQKVTVLLVSHEINEIVSCAKRIFFLEEKKLKVLDEKDINKENLSKMLNVKVELLVKNNRKIIL
jgi:ABC-type Mn2+/Zn2+ transport system ATPase subunit